MKTAAPEFIDELVELRATVRDYRATKADRDAELRAWRKARRELVDICIAHCDAATLEAILTHLERTCWRLGTLAGLARLASAKPPLLAVARAGAILVISPVGTPCTARCGSPASAWKRMPLRP
jgi:hypothetical protein